MSDDNREPQNFDELLKIFGESPNSEKSYLLRVLLQVCPNGSLEEDQDGQLIFYTNLTEKSGGDLEEMD
jgi:hypothetical protein